MNINIILILIIKYYYYYIEGECEKSIVVDGRDYRTKVSRWETGLLDEMAKTMINELVVEKLSRPPSVNSVS